MFCVDTVPCRRRPVKFKRGGGGRIFLARLGGGGGTGTGLDCLRVHFFCECSQIYAQEY